MTAGARTRAPSIGALCLLGVVVFALIVGLGRLDDNSFFTHLATGRVILDEGSIPNDDIYSWSEPGSSWVVQSWLPSILYAATEKLGGAMALRLLFGAQFLGLALIVWRLTKRATSLLPRVAIVGLALLIGKVGWSERPLLIGLLCLGAALLAVDGDLDARWLIPIGWIWANSHGSFPLGLVVLGVLAVGSRLDGERRPAELRPLGMLAAGVVLGAVSPLGPRLLLFPVALLSNSEVLSNVVEWRAPGFTVLWERVFLIQLAVAWLALVKRPSWRAGLAVAAMSGLALIALRNVVVASIVLSPILADAWGQLGSLRLEARMRLGGAVAAALVALGALGTAVRLGEHHFNLAIYPVEAVEWLRRSGVEPDDHRMVNEDFVGNYLELAEGTAASVFYDDRFDMYSAELSEDYFDLVVARPGALDVLDRYEADLVLWRRDGALAGQLELSPEWRIAYVDQRFLIACRRVAAGERCESGL